MATITKWTVLKIFLYAMILVSTVLIIRLLSKPSPATFGYLLTHPITFIAFTYAYYKSRNKFWLIMLLSVPPMFISDLYFLPSFSLIFPHGGAGMNTWAGLHLLVIAVGCLLYFKNTGVRVVNVLVMIGMVLTNTNFATIALSSSGIGRAVALILQSLIFLCYLPYYGFRKKNFAFSFGSILQFIGITIADLYFFTVSHSITPVTLAWTDKIITLGRHPMAIGALQDKKL